MKLIFLDWDGVILPLPQDGHFDPNVKHSVEAMNNLNLIIQVTGAKIIVSSSWRFGRSVEDLQALLVKWGFKWTVLDKLPEVVGEEDRGELILSWVEAREPVEQFLVLDDEPATLEPLAKNLVLIKPDVGIQFHDVQEAIRILSR